MFDDVLKVSSYKAGYSSGGKVYAPDVEELPKSTNMLPPDWQAKRGRLQKKRIRSAGGPGGVQPKKAHRCANCTLLGKPGQGHYARNCPFPPFLPGVIAALPGASDRGVNGDVASNRASDRRRAGVHQQRDRARRARAAKSDCAM